MSRIACVLLLTLCSAQVHGGDLPPGAIARLGDPSFRTGSRVLHLALSPDGKQYATVSRIDRGYLALMVWDATGCPMYGHRVNHEPFRGCVWGSGGARAAAIRTELGPKEEYGRLFPDEFRIWDFTDAVAKLPPLLPVMWPGIGCGSNGGGYVCAARPEQSPTYTDFRFAADGTRVAARWKSADGKKHAIHVFELAPGAKPKQVSAIDLGAEGVDEFHVSGDGETVVTFRKLAPREGERAVDYAATTWDLSDKPSKPVQVRASCFDERLMLTPDARGLVLYVTGAEEWGFDLFDLRTGTRRKLVRWAWVVSDAVEGFPEDRGGFAFSADGRILAVARDGQTFVIDVPNGKELGRLEGHAGTPTAVAISADGATIATADRYGLVRLWNTKGLTARSDAPGHRAPVRYVELSPDGKRLLTCADDHTVRLWDLATGTELRAFTGAAVPQIIDNKPTFTPDGTTILFNANKQLVARDLLSGLEVPLPGGMKELTKPAFVGFAPDGKSAVTMTGFGEPVEVWDWPSGKKRCSLALTATDSVPGIGGGFTVDSKTVYRDLSWDGWDAATGKKLTPAPWPEGGEFHQARSLRPNAPIVFNSHNGQPTRVLEPGTGKLVPTPLLDRVHDGFHFFPNNIAFSPDYRQFLSRFEDDWNSFESEAILCETATGQERRRFGGHRGDVRVLGFTPDGSKLLTAGGDHTILVWDVRLQAVPLPDAFKKETSAVKLWNLLAGEDAKAAYLAMARLSREPKAAVKMAKLRLKPAAKGAPESEASKVADSRAIELLEALATDEAQALLKELAGGEASAFRTQEVKRALKRHE